MKILSWNCNGAFRKKYTLLSEYDADIYVIQECENPSTSSSEEYKKWGENHIWVGDNKNKGLGIFCKPGIVIEPLNWSNLYVDHSVKYFLPCKIAGIKILGIWAHKNNSPNFGYIGQIWKYLQINVTNIENTVLVGDFNSNTIWDQWDRWWNHSDVIKQLECNNIHSVYHTMNNEEFGKEKTFFLQKNESKSYHIDYCFAPKSIKIKNFSIGEFHSWKDSSDHVPLIIDISK